MVELSVVTVTLNDPTGLAKTLQSLVPLNELMGPESGRLEVVVVDSSPELNDKVFTLLNSKLRLRRNVQRPKGIYSAMNEGAALAKGKWIWFLNGGDELKNPHALLGAIQIAESDPEEPELLLGGANLYRGETYLYPKIPKNALIQNILGGNRICHQAVMIQKAVFDQIGSFNLKYKLAADYDHFWRCYLAGVRSKSFRAIWVTYDLSGTSGTNWDESLKEFYKISLFHRYEMGRSLFASQMAMLGVEATRVLGVKALANSPFAEWLRPAWIAFNRIRGIGAR
jgi:glycosyltransferase involved in cell wall biosynthesis